MTAFQKIIDAISPFGYPHAPDTYGGDADRYFTYNYADERVTLYADNAPRIEVAHVQVHFFLPAAANFIAEKGRIRKALLKCGFTYPDVTVLTEAEKNIRHIVFECETETDEMEE